jgi:F-box domain
MSLPDSMAFVSLPSELHLHILGHLDLVSLLNATATNHYFHDLLSSIVLKNAILAHEPILLDRRKALQTQLMNMGQTMGEADKRGTLANALCLPCYNCFKIKDLKNNFHEYVESTEWRLCGEKAEERLCVHCDALVSPVAEPFVMRVINTYRQKNKRIKRAMNVR